MQYRLSPKKLVKARAAMLDVSQSELARRLDLNPCNYNRLERGSYASSPSLDLAMRIAIALHCPLESLVEEVD